MQKHLMNLFGVMFIFCGLCLMFIMCVFVGGVTLEVAKHVLEWANVL